MNIKAELKIVEFLPIKVHYSFLPFKNQAKLQQTILFLLLLAEHLHEIPSLISLINNGNIFKTVVIEALSVKYGSSKKFGLFHSTRTYSYFLEG